MHPIFHPRIVTNCLAHSAIVFPLTVILYYLADQFVSEQLKRLFISLLVSLTLIVVRTEFRDADPFLEYDSASLAFRFIFVLRGWFWIVANLRLADRN